MSVNIVYYFETLSELVGAGRALRKVVMGHPEMKACRVKERDRDRET